MPLNKKCLLKSKTESQPSTFQLPYCGLFSLIYLLHTAPCARLAASNVKSTTIDLLGKIPAKWQGGFSLKAHSKSHADYSDSQSVILDQTRGEYIHHRYIMKTIILCFHNIVKYQYCITISPYRRNFFEIVLVIFFVFIRQKSRS